MSEVALRVEGLGKRYRLGEAPGGYKTLRETLMQASSRPIRAIRSLSRPGTDGSLADTTLWALRDISFEVKAGEVVGIIGRNGAGKTTLLKLLSRITEPTAGYADIYGRVGSLLEVGTGFHPELTGRENIYLNGAILGMRRAEIDAKFDEIVAFAEIERFLDTPVKRYSSGMYVRLAFAVAAHLEPEILVVDEVLAVGDAEFQKKCLTKMQEIGRGGRTILFVSHNMSAIRNICRRGMVLERGRLVAEGEVNAVVDRYLAQQRERQEDAGTAETHSFVIDEVRIESRNGPVIKTFDAVDITVTFTAKEDILDPGLYVGLLTAEYQRLAGLDLKDFLTIPAIQAGQHAELGFTVDQLPLLPGSYQLEIHLKDMAHYKVEFVPETFGFEVAEMPVYGGRKLDSWYGHIGLRARAGAGAGTREEPNL